MTLAELLIGGAGGYIIGSAGKTAKQSVSQPLLDPVQVPVITTEDYLKFDIFPGVTTGNLWLGFIVSDGTHEFMVVSAFNSDYSHRVRIVEFSRGFSFEKTVSGAIIKMQGTDIVMTSEFGTARINTVDHTGTVDLVVDTGPGGFINISLSHSGGSPFCYNNKKIAIVVPDLDYLSGFEVVGTGHGTINGISVSGWGDLEHINFNFDNRIPPLEQWIAWSTSQSSGVIYQQTTYFDSGFWINGVFYKPLSFKIDTHTWIGIMPANQTVLAVIDDGNFLRLELEYIGQFSRQAAYKVSAFKNDVSLGQGYAWEEFSW